MTDIVERLRERLRGNFADDDDELDAEAADEIERLRRGLQIERDALLSEMDGQRAEMRELRAEIGRLRVNGEALITAITRQLAARGKGIEPSDNVKEAIAVFRAATTSKHKEENVP